MPIVGVEPPVEVMGAVAPTETTAAPAVMPSSLAMSAADIDPAAAGVAALMPITAAAAGPVFTTGVVTPTDDTAAPAVMPSSLVLSAADIDPAADVVAAAIASVRFAERLADVPPSMERGAVVVSTTERVL